MVKKFYLPLLIIGLVSIACFSQNWKLVWSDEFKYTGIPDSNKWGFDIDGNSWDWGNNELQNYTPASKNNARADGEYLIIEARKEKWTYPGDNQERDYTSARLRTIRKGDWTCGRVEVRAKLPAGRGTWPAIWMLSTDNAYGAWPKSGELDIMEHVGFDPGKIHCTIHSEAYNHMLGTQQGANKIISDPFNAFYTYVMEWSPDRIDFYINTDKIFTFNNDNTGNYKTWPFDKRFHLLLNIAVGGNWGGQQGVDTTIFPVRMSVDYVRVYEKATSPIHASLHSTRHPSLKISPLHNGNPMLYITLYRSSNVLTKLFSAAGSILHEKTAPDLQPGSHTICLGNKHTALPSGMYLVLVQTRSTTFIEKFCIVR